MLRRVVTFEVEAPIDNSLGCHWVEEDWVKWFNRKNKDGLIFSSIKYVGTHRRVNPPGEIRLVFDANAWNLNGGDDILTGNQKFWKPAEIANRYFTDDGKDELCDVVFQDTGEFSRGHFYNVTRPLDNFE